MVLRALNVCRLLLSGARIHGATDLENSPPSGATEDMAGGLQVQRSQMILALHTCGQKSNSPKTAFEYMTTGGLGAPWTFLRTRLADPNRSCGSSTGGSTVARVRTSLLRRRYAVVHDGPVSLNPFCLSRSPLYNCQRRSCHTTLKLAFPLRREGGNGAQEDPRAGSGGT